MSMSMAACLNTTLVKEPFVFLSLQYKSVLQRPRSSASSTGIQCSAVAPIQEKSSTSSGSAQNEQSIVRDEILQAELANKSRSRPSSGANSLASAFCNVVEEAVYAMELLTLPRPRASDPAVQLADNFYPLAAESPPQPCPLVTGTIPASLNGVYVRNGPNPPHLPKGGYHAFDGDGMVHAVRIRDGHASHCCRYTRTNRYLAEAEAGRALFTRALGELRGLAGIARLGLLGLRHALGVIDTGRGIGPANAGMAFFNGRLLAMSEDDMPYELRVDPDTGDVRTVGRFDFGGRLESPMTAHPKVDPATGEMFSYSYDLLLPPYLTYFRVAPDGTKLPGVPIALREPTLVHDFAVTRRYAVFCEHQMVFRLPEMLAGRSPIVCDPRKVARVGVLPKYAASSEGHMRWFDGATCFHFLNAWEEDDEVVMVGSVNEPVEVIFEHPERLECRLTEFRFNMRTGESLRQQICSANIDVGRINEGYIGRKNRYAYLCTSGPWPNYSGVAKVDFQAPRLPPMPSKPGVDTGEPCIVGWHHFGQGCYGSEPFFVPRKRPSSPNPHDSVESGGLEEDDGYVLAFVHNQLHNHSELLIMDAQSPTLSTLASIRMPTRVPNGFHGLFIDEQQLAQC